MKHTGRRGSSLGALAVSILLLAGCGDGAGPQDEPPSDDTATTATTAPEPTASPDDDASPSPDDDLSPSPDDDVSPTPAETAGGPTATATSTAGATATASAGGEAAALATAVGTAEAAAGEDGQAFGVDREDSPASWEIVVAAGDREHDVYVSQDGNDVISQEEDDLDNDDRERLRRVQVPLADALGTALGAVNGALDEAALETEDGTTVWEIEIEEASGSSVDVYVNAVDGSVLGIDR